MRTPLAFSLAAVGLIAAAVMAAPKPYDPSPVADRSTVQWDILKFPDDPDKRGLVSGVFKSFSLTAHQPDGMPLREVRSVQDLKGVRAVLEVDVASIDSGIGLRDDRLRNVLFETPKFPKARFELSGFRFPLGEPAGDWKKGDLVAVTVSGDLTLHGVTQTLNDVRLDARVEEDGILLTSATPIRLEPRAFGLPVPVLEKICGHAIDQKASVQLQLFFKRG